MKPKHDPKSHIAQIKKYLRGGGKLTPIKALVYFGCHRLAARISDLKKEGFRVDKKMIETENGKRIAQYYAL